MLPRFVLAFLLFTLAARPARAQPDAFDRCLALSTGTDYAGYVPFRICLFDYLRTADTLTVKAILSRLSTEAGKRDDAFLPLYTQTAYVEYVLRYRSPWPLDSIMAGLEGVVQAATRLDDAPHIAWAECNLAITQFGTRQYDGAFERAMRIHNRVRDISESRMPDRGDILGLVANFYYYFSEYRQAVDILSEAVKGPPSASRPPSVGRRCYNTLGLCYRQLGRYDSSDRCFHLALAEARREGDSAWVSIIRGNIGINLYQRGRHAEAIPLLTEDVRASVARQDWDNAAGSLLPLADISMLAGKINEAGAMLDTARRYIGIFKTTSRLPLYYSLRIREAIERGDERGVHYTDSLVSIKDSLARQYSALHLARAEQQLSNASLRIRLADAASSKRLATLQRNGLVVVLLLTCALAGLAIAYHRRQRREASRQADADMLAKEAELNNAEVALTRFQQDVHEKAELIDRLSARLDESDHADVLQQLRDATILTDDQWAEFRRMFEKVHTGFIARLQQQYPSLSPGEVRFLVLARLGFSRKEMAGALGISPASVRSTWLRLRRKLGLDEEVQVEALVEGI